MMAAFSIFKFAVQNEYPYDVGDVVVKKTPFG